MAKDKVFGAKVSSGKQFIDPGKSWLDYYYEDQAKRQKEAEKGQVRYTEAAKASRIQYTLPQYQGKSQNQGKTYNWERELMQNEKIKGAGNSYTKKFNALTSRMGMTPGQAEEFRKYMDFQEESQHVDPKMNKDKSINQSQSLKYARDAHLKTDIIDGILNNMHKTGVARAKKAGEVPFEKVSAWDKIQNSLGFKYTDEQKNTLEAEKLGVEPHYGGKKDKTDPVTKARWTELQATKAREDAANPKTTQTPQGNSFLDDLLKIGKAGLQSATHLKTPAQANIDIAREYANQGTVPTDTTQEISRGITHAANAFGLGTIKEAAIKNQDPYYTGQVFNQREGGAKAADLGYDALGYLGSGLGSYKLASPIIKKIFGDIASKKISETAGKELIKKLGVEALRGSTAGAALTGGEVGVKEALNPDNQNWKDNLAHVGFGAGIGAGADVGLGLLGKGISGGLGRFAKVDGELPTYSGNPSNQILDSLVPNTAKDKTLGGNISSQSDELFSRLLGQETPKPTSTPSMDNFVPESIPTVKDPTNILDELMFGQSGNGPKARGTVDQVPMARYAKEDISKMADTTLNHVNQSDGANQRLLEVQQEMKTMADNRGIYRQQLTPDELYTHVRKEGDPATFDDLIKAAELEANVKPIPKDIKSILRNDPRVAEQIKALNTLGGTKAPQEPSLNGNYGQADMKGIDDILSLLEGKPNRTIENAPTPGIRQNLDEILKNVNNSQATNIGQPSSNATDELLMKLSELGKKPKTEAVKPAQADGGATGADDLLMRLDSQVFNNETTANSLIGDTKPIQTVSAIDSIKNPIKRRLNKFYENAVNSSHSAKVAHTQVLENAIKKAEESGLQPKKVAALKEQLKSVKKNGSDLEKSIQNQAAAGNKAKTFLDGHMDHLQEALGSTKPEVMAEAIRYQVAKNIRWIWDNVNPDYVVGGGWDKGRVNTIVNSGIGNTKLESFTNAMKNLTQERLDLALKHNLINKNAHTALSKNPFYIPMARDVTPGMDNVARGLKEGTTKNKGQAGAYFIQSLGDGDAEALYKDPLETLMTGTFSLFKNIAKEDTHKQLYNMAKLDSDKLFSRVVSKKEFDSKGGIAVPTPKGTKYIQIQDDLQKMIQENDLPYDLNVLGKITSRFAGLKTRSLEYHMTGVPRDLAEGYLKGQINNPIKYLSELVKAAKEHNLSAKQAGAYFDKAYKDGMNGINQEQMMKEYARQNGNVKPFNPKNKESWKDLTSTILRIADMPFKPIKAIGQLSDELPRTIEVKETQKAFMKQHGAKIDNIKRALDQVNAKIESSSQATDPFDPALQGIDKLKGQKAKLENMLNNYSKDLEREQTFRGRDIMNFSRAGRGGVAKHIRQYMIFANTTTQSKDKLIRSFIERPGATIGKVALLTAPLVYAEHVMHQNLTEGDKKIYDNLPGWAKQYNYVYVNNGSVYTVPKIQELALLTNPIEAILAGNKDDLNASARLAAKEAIPYQMGNFAQGLVPNTDGSVTMRKNFQVPSTVFSPTLDVAANDKLGFNRNAISFGDKFGRKDAKANKFTMDLFTKTFGNKARADYAQYLATQYPGDAGKYGVHILDWLLEPGNNDKLDAMIQNLNPLQDRVYSKNGEIGGHKVVKNPPKKPAVKK